MVIPGFEEAKEKTENRILVGEKFKATVNVPQGMDLNTNLSRQFGQGCGLSDDEFFHITCHIDKNTQEKIEKGDYVDLEKLLPKTTYTGALANTDGTNHLEWVQKDGHTFLAPANDRQGRINGFRRWEQAFRMYATIYCGANPARAREIWQYISVINTASSAYVWENVYSYDITFRHLMAFNPQRSWSTTYNQMWNLSMREPLNKTKTSFANNTGGITAQSIRVIMANQRN